MQKRSDVLLFHTVVEHIVCREIVFPLGIELLFGQSGQIHTFTFQ
jgi:hypothetical protein